LYVRTNSAWKYWIRRNENHQTPDQKENGTKKNHEQNRELTSIALGLPIAQRLTLWSSPPVTRTLDDFLPILRQLTLEEWATNSSFQAILKEIVVKANNSSSNHYYYQLSNSLFNGVYLFIYLFYFLKDRSEMNKAKCRSSKRKKRVAWAL
jgi:predicted PurR-regulated permease PerM